MRWIDEEDHLSWAQEAVDLHLLIHGSHRRSLNKTLQDGLGGNSIFEGIDHHTTSEVKRGIYCLLSKALGGSRYCTYRTHFFFKRKLLLLEFWEGCSSTGLQTFRTRESLQLGYHLVIDTGFLESGC